MASFHINLANNGSGVFTPTVIRNGTAASGGTTVPINWVDNNLNGNNTNTKLLGTAVWMAFNAMFNNISQTPANNNSAWYITIADDGSQNYTPTVRFGGTPASGGTTLTLPWVVNNLNGASTTSDLKSALLRVTSDAIFNSTSTNGV
jgi:hypothetical protein